MQSEGAERMLREEVGRLERGASEGAEECLGKTGWVWRLEVAESICLR